MRKKWQKFEKKNLGTTFFAIIPKQKKNWKFSDFWKNEHFFKKKLKSSWFTSKMLFSQIHGGLACFYKIENFL